MIRNPSFQYFREAVTKIYYVGILALVYGRRLQSITNRKKLPRFEIQTVKRVKCCLQIARISTSGPGLVSAVLEFQTSVIFFIYISE